ncbi:MAG: hypothetical protein H0U52_03735 [Chloroflexi bacterium]|nr:hypothetical protein [Chloroflexota bacterium]
MAVLADFMARAEVGRAQRRSDAPERSAAFLAAVEADPTSLARSAGAGRLTGRAGDG